MTTWICVDVGNGNGRLELGGVYRGRRCSSDCCLLTDDGGGPLKWFRPVTRDQL